MENEVRMGKTMRVFRTRLLLRSLLTGAKVLGVLIIVGTLGFLGWNLWTDYQALKTQVADQTALVKEGEKATAVFNAVHEDGDKLGNIVRIENPWVFLWARDGNSYSEIILQDERYYVIPVKAVDEAQKAGATPEVKP